MLPLALRSTIAALLWLAAAARWSMADKSADMSQGTKPGRDGCGERALRGGRGCKTMGSFVLREGIIYISILSAARIAGPVWAFLMLSVAVARAAARAAIVAR